MKDHPLSRAYQVTTDLLQGGRLIQTTIDLQGEALTRYINTQEAQTRAALIALGWLPPDREPGTREDHLRLYGVAFEVDGQVIHPSRVTYSRRS